MKKTKLFVRNVNTITDECDVKKNVGDSSHDMIKTSRKALFSVYHATLYSLL